PFLIGVQRYQNEGVTKQQRVIHVDLDNPRVNETEGELLFLAYGGNTPYLEYMACVLEAIHHGYDSNEKFIARLLEFDLLESVVLDSQLKDGSTHEMQGYYTINEEKLNALIGVVFSERNSELYLQPIYMMLAYPSNIAKLVERKNSRL